MSRLDVETWRIHPITQLVLTALGKLKVDLTEKVLAESDNLDDQNLDRRLIHYNGSVRALTQVIDNDELLSLLDDYKMLKEQV